MEFWDQILVLNHGRVAERGTHRELMHREGWYQRMVRNSLGPSVRQGP
jgi:ABC-type multidrug transport system fused ATPase/permease subunit